MTLDTNMQVYHQNMVMNVTHMTQKSAPKRTLYKDVRCVASQENPGGEN